jgi:hypothetical protein
VTSSKRHYDAQRMPYQLVLRDETLAVLALVAPDRATAREFQRARDVMSAGHLNITQVHDAEAALHQDSHMLGREALDAARADFREGLSHLDLHALASAGRDVSVFPYDPERDEPRRAIDDHNDFSN